MKKARFERTQESRERARRKLQSIQPKPETLERVSPEELKAIKEKDHPSVRRMGWFAGKTDYEAFGTGGYADPAGEYDMWAQAYRMLGGFIDCDHSWDGDNHHSGSGDQDQEEENEGGCSRWMMWAAYVNPNYQGNGYYEYFGDDNPPGVLDCHSPDTEWELLGVYRQEFYQFIEQISKHLWAIDEYEYVVALAGLAYMTGDECFQVGQDNSGNSIYASIAPKSYGNFEMALYTDDKCLCPDESTGKTYDSYGLTSDIDLGSNDGDDDNSYGDAVYWWQDAQEYTLTNLNEVYDTFKYCTTCIDYPTYQDGYFIGDYGTDDDDLINQCWKFHSHDSFTCDADCIALGHAQGSILSINYQGVTFGHTPSGFYSAYKDGDGDVQKAKGVESKWTRLAANAFLTLSFLVFVATFLAFAVARRSRQRERRSGKSRRLLDGERRSKSASRRKSSRREGDEADGVFRDKSSDRKKSSSSRSKSRSRSEGKSYKPPAEERKRRSSKSKSGSSRRHVDDF